MFQHRSLRLVIVLLLAAAVRLYHLQAQSIWFDEGWSAYAAAQPTLSAVIEAEPTNPPLYYLLLHATVRGFGDSVLALRYVSLLLGVLAVALAFQLGRGLFDERAGWWSALLAAFNPLLWWASQEGRMYTLLAVLVLVAALAFHRLLRRPTRAAWLALWGAELALLYAHNTGPVAAVWLNAAALLAWGVSVSRRSLPRKDARIWRVWLAGQAAVALLWSPWFISRFLLLGEANSAVAAAPTLNADFFSRLWQALWAGSWQMVGREPAISVLSAVLLLMALVLIPWRRPAARWLAAHVILLTGSLLLGLLVLGNEMHGRYLVMVVPLILVAAGAGLARTRNIVSLPFAAIFLVTFAVSIHLNTTDPAYQHDDARGMVSYYAEHLTSSDTVLAWSYADRYDLWYYWSRLGAAANRVTLPEGADLDAVLPLLPESGDVALNVWYTQRADYRGMMGCILGHGTINLPEQFTVYGMSSLIYRSPALVQPEVRAFSAVSAPARVTAAGSIPASTPDRALCLPLQITLSPGAADLKAAVIVRNSLGWEIARADAVFADAAQRTGSQLPAGSVLTAYPLLRLPVGAPAGDYPVLLRVYDESVQPSGYDLAVSTDERGAKDLPLGEWRALPGAEWGRVNRETDLPVRGDWPAGGLRLLAHDQRGGTVRNGDTLRLTLLWQGSGDLPDLTLAGESWSVVIPPLAPVPSERMAADRALDWREAAVPADAPAGEAELRLPDGTVIAGYTVEVIPALVEAPAFSTPVQADFPGVGRLVGFTLEGDSFDRTQPVPVTLVWQAPQPSAVSYTVFVQLVSADGRVLAQSDTLPAQAQRPTTGWRDGEYIVDSHALAFHADAAPGPAALIAGMYDARTGQRLTLVSGQDYVTLAESILIR